MAGLSKSRLFRYLTLKLKSFLFTKDVLSFLVFLLLSATFWFVNALNKERELTMSLPVVYKGVPKDLMFVDELPSQIEVKVKDLGLNLWTYVGKKPGPVVIPFNQEIQENGMFSVSYSQLFALVTERLLPSSMILLMGPEKISSKYVRLHTKVLPVELISSITLGNQFMLSQPLEMEPREIEVYGPRYVIERLTKISTKILTVKELKDTISIQVSLEEIPSVSYSVDHVLVRASAEMFTEKVVFIPVQIINNPSNLSILTFPAEIKVVFNISVSKFKSFENNDIQLVIDFDEIVKGDLTKKRLKIINNKPYITNIRIEPEEVEFLLEEK